MDAQRWRRLAAIFDEVVDAPASSRAALLDHLCADDADLRRDVEKLLAADASSPDFESNAEAARDRAALEWSGNDARDPAGARIGPWRVVREIGHGGMGVVLLAERADEQFEQHAALKLVKRGMDSEAVHARFLRERQILARLQHAHIARLLDGGLAEDGRPYFAMEYIDGEPLLTFCARHELNVEQRIRMFLTICDAVQFAHAQLVVHRDIKPSNILVTSTGEAKLLDFGIAKLLDDSGDGATIDAQHRPLTPAYAAPEQLRGEPVTIATDVYALGCVLYELLTSHRPFDFGTPTPHEALRVQESSTLDAPSRVGDADAPFTPRQLRGDLDTIALTALKREPELRYATVAAFADDLSRYLSGQPIHARRHRTWYRFSKFVQRHRAGVAAAFVGLVLLCVGFGVAVWQAREKAREAEVSSQVTQFVVGLFNDADPSRTRGAVLSAQDLLDHGSERLRADRHLPNAVRARLLRTVATTYTALGIYDRALPLAQESLDLRRSDPQNEIDLADSLDQVGDIRRLQGDDAGAEPLFDESLTIRRRVLAHDDPRLIEGLDHKGLLLHARGNFQLADGILADALERARRHFGNDAVEVARYLDDYASNADDFGQRADAITAYRSALAIRTKNLPADDPDIATSMLHLGVVLDDNGNSSEALTLLESARATFRKVFGNEHPLVGLAEVALASVYDATRRMDDANASAASALEILRRTLPPDHPKTIEALNMLATLRAEQRDFAGSITLYREVVARFVAKEGLTHPDTLTAKNNLSYALGHVGKLSEAEQLQREVIAEMRDDNGEGTLAVDCENLAGTLEREGKFDEAVTVSRRAVDIEVKRTGTTSIRAAVAFRLLAVAEEMRGDPEAAERDFRTALHIQEELSRTQGTSTWEGKISLADMLVGSARCAEAVPLLNDALANLSSGEKQADPRWKPEAELLLGSCERDKHSQDGLARMVQARDALRVLPNIEMDLYPSASKLYEDIRRVHP